MDNDALAEAVRQANDAAYAAALSAQAAQSAPRALAGGPGEAVSEAAGLAAHAASGGSIDPFVFRLSILLLAIFVGYYVVWSVTPALHTPLMSTNAISSVIVVGALLAVGVPLVGEGTGIARLFGFLALVLASVNIFGGLLVTQRMLATYKPRTTR